MIPGPEKDYEYGYDYYSDLIPFVFGGTDAEEGTVPWIALVTLKGKGTSTQPICGGVLISRRCVATAAHCVSNG